MRFSYFDDTDSLYIDLSDRSSVESREVSAGIVLDFDEGGALVGIDIDAASRRVELNRLTLANIPAEVERETS